MNKSFIRCIVLSICICFLHYQCVFAVSCIDHLGVADGLSHYSINEFYQDEYERMWVGTRHGLNCISGSECRIIQSDSTNTYLPNDYIRHICGDGQGSILLQCASAAVFMDLLTEKTIEIEKNGVQTIYYGIGHYLYAARDSVFTFSPTQGKQCVYTADKRITSIMENEQGLWVATEKEVLCISTIHEHTVIDTISHPRVCYIYNDSATHQVWLCSRTEGLVSYDGIHSATYLSHQDVRTIVRSNTGQLWAGTWSGLVQVDEQKQETISIQRVGTSSDTHPFSVWALASDKQGTLWIGSFFGAIDLYNPTQDLFSFWEQKPEPMGLSHPIVSCVVTDGQRTWVGTNGGGVCEINNQNQLVRYIPIDNHVPQCAVKALSLDTLNHTLWVGTHGMGLMAIHLSTYKQHTFLHETQHLPNNRVRSIVNYNDTLYFSTEKGIGWVDLSTLTFGALNDIDVVGELSDLHLRGEQLWFARQKTAYCYSIPNRKLTKITTPSAILCFAHDMDGNLYAGTNKGVFLLNETTMKWEMPPDIQKAFSNRLCTNLLFAPNCCIIGSIGDIVILNREQQLTHHLRYANGFPIEIPTERSLYLTAEQQLFVGGTNGLCAFPLQKILHQKTPCTIIPSAIHIQNQAEQVRTLTAGLPSLKQITLNTDDRDIRILFSTTHHCSALAPNLQYKLSGYEENWQDATALHEAAYANLPPGNYQFIVKDDCNDTWTIDIIVPTPFYLSWWAFVLYMLCIVGALIAVSLYANRKATNKAKARIDEQKRILEKQNEQILRMKEHLENAHISFATRARAIIMQHLDNPNLNVDMLAREMCISRSSMYTKLQDAIGQTPNELIMSIRLEEAARMLRESPDNTITEIAENVGFSSNSYFIKCFSRQYNKTPNQYRKTLAMGS